MQVHKYLELCSTWKAIDGLGEGREVGWGMYRTVPPRSLCVAFQKEAEVSTTFPNWDLSSLQR